jgi:hypothetical protein
MRQIVAPNGVTFVCTHHYAWCACVLYLSPYRTHIEQIHLIDGAFSAYTWVSYIWLLAV